MGYSVLLDLFFQKASNDARISIAHIGLYVALLQNWQEDELSAPKLVSAHIIMPKAKISSTATYYRLIRELDEYGFIEYESAYYKNFGSRVKLKNV